MADGSISRSAESPASIISSTAGNARDVTVENSPAAWSIYSSSPFCWTPGLAIFGPSRSPTPAMSTAEVKASQSRPSTCSNRETFLVINNSRILWMVNFSLSLSLSYYMLIPSSGRALATLPLETFRRHFQVTEQNPIVGDSSRVQLLNRVGSSFLALPNIFGENGRPGSLVGQFV